MPCALHRHSSPLPNKPTKHFYTPPPIGSFLCRRIAFFLIPTNSIPPFLWRYKPYTPHAQRCVHPSIMLKMATWSKLAAQFYQHCATIYSNLYGGTTDVSQQTFLYFVRKTNFQNFLDPFPGPLGLTTTIFEFPYSPYISTKFFPPFDLISFTILLSHSRRFDIFCSHISHFFKIFFKIFI